MELLFNKKVSQALLLMLNSFNCFKRVHYDTITFYFSLYKNGVPGSGKSSFRSISTVQVHENKTSNLPIKIISSDYELAFNSLVKIDKRSFHLPLIDFNYHSFDEIFKSALNEIKEKYPGKIYIFYSGRSFHGYHDILLSENHWKQYLGDLLLLNKTYATEEIVDSRWIGHSLKQGFSSLRITYNTKAYLMKPKFKCVF